MLTLPYKVTTVVLLAQIVQNNDVVPARTFRLFCGDYIKSTLCLRLQCRVGIDASFQTFVLSLALAAGLRQTFATAIYDETARSFTNRSCFVFPPTTIVVN